jgi:hypothetical protein
MDDVIQNSDILNQPLLGPKYALFKNKYSVVPMDIEESINTMVDNYNNLRVVVLGKMGYFDYKLKISESLFGIIGKTEKICDSICGSLIFEYEHGITSVHQGNKIYSSGCNQNSTDIIEGGNSSFIIHNTNSMLQRKVYIDWPSSQQLVSLLNLSNKVRSLFIFSVEGLWILSIDRDFKWSRNLYKDYEGFSVDYDFILNKLHESYSKFDNFKFVTNNNIRNKLYNENVTYDGDKVVADSSFNIWYSSEHKSNLIDRYVYLISRSTISIAMNLIELDKDDKEKISTISNKYPALVNTYIMNLNFYRWDQINPEDGEGDGIINIFADL